MPQWSLGNSWSKLLDKWLLTFIVEIRRADGHSYPPKPLDNILPGLLHYIWSLPLENVPNSVQDLLATRNNLYKSLWSTGIGAEVSSAVTISKEELDRLWASGIHTSDTPRALVQATFFVGLHACLRGQRTLISAIQHFSRYSSPERWMYIENCSKNRQLMHGRFGLSNVPCGHQIYMCQVAYDNTRIVRDK